MEHTTSVQRQMMDTLAETINGLPTDEVVSSIMVGGQALFEQVTGLLLAVNRGKRICSTTLSVRCESDELQVCFAMALLARLGYCRYVRPSRSTDLRGAGPVAVWERLELGALARLALEAEVSGPLG